MVVDPKVEDPKALGERLAQFVHHCVPDEEAYKAQRFREGRVVIDNEGSFPHPRFITGSSSSSSFFRLSYPADGKRRTPSRAFLGFASIHWLGAFFLSDCLLLLSLGFPHSEDENFTVISIDSREKDQTGLLLSIASCIAALGITIDSASICTECQHFTGGRYFRFLCTKVDGKKLDYVDASGTIFTLSLIIENNTIHSSRIH